MGTERSVWRGKETLSLSVFLKMEGELGRLVRRWARETRREMLSAWARIVWVDKRGTHIEERATRFWVTEWFSVVWLRRWSGVGNVRNFSLGIFFLKTLILKLPAYLSTSSIRMEVIWRQSPILFITLPSVPVTVLSTLYLQGTLLNEINGQTMPFAKRENKGKKTGLDFKVNIIFSHFEFSHNT